MSTLKQVLEMYNDYGYTLNRAEVGTIVDALRAQTARADALNVLAGRITHCDNCGGDWVNNGLQAMCWCVLINTLNEKLKLLEEDMNARFGLPTDKNGNG